MYVGAASSSTKYDYRSRLTFPALNTAASIGSSRIKVTAATLHLRRNDGGPTTVTVGCSSDSSWSATPDATASGSVSSATGWYAIDLTPLADAIAEYPSNWYLHLSGDTPRLRCDGTGKSTKPYLEVTWEYVAATITGDKTSVPLGETVTFTVTPETDGETHTLTYALGDASGTIAENAGDAITWTPPVALASEIIADDTATVRISMTAYDSNGETLRTELYYQTVTVPDSVAPTITSIGATLSGDLSSYGLSGRTSLELAPELDMNAAYGATLASVIAEIVSGPPVVIISQPTDFTGPIGSTASFTVEAAGSGLTYQWHYRANETAAWNTSATATPTYSIEVASWRDGYQYYCTVTDASGYSVDTNIVTLTVGEATTTSTTESESTGTTLQTVQWTALTESEPGVFTGATARTNPVTAEGTVTVFLTATDSRGRSATATQTFTFCAYAAPVVSEFSVERYEPVYDDNEEVSGYVASDLGGYVWVNLIASVTSVSPEDAELNNLTWTLTGEDTESGETVSASGSGAQSISLIADRSVLPDPVGEDETWTYTLTLTDSAGGTAIRYSAVAPGHAALSISPDKRGVAVGMIANGTKADPRFESAYPAWFYGGAFDGDGNPIGARLMLSELTADATTVPNQTNTDIALFTAEADGAYLIAFSASWAGNSEGVRAAILLDAEGTSRGFSRIHAGGSSVVQQNVTAVVRLNAGESAQARVWQSSGGELSLNYYAVQVVKVG